MFDFLRRFSTLMLLLAFVGSLSAQDAALDEQPEAICTLAEQIISANSNGKVGDCPLLDGMESFQLREDIILTEELPAITGHLIIDGNGHSISGDKRFRIFEVSRGSLRVLNLKMLNGKAGSGSAIFADQGAKVYMEASSIRGSFAIHSGAIFARNSLLFINDSEFSKNIGDRGGAIYSAASAIHVTRSRFEGNTAIEGGAIYHYLGRGAIKQSEFHQNKAAEEGGAISNAHGALQVRDSNFSHNQASNGGAIHSLGYDSLLSIADSRFEENYSRWSGGAIYANSDEVYISDSRIESNSAGAAGGGIFSKRGALFLSYSGIRHNTSTSGAGIYADGGSLTVVDTAVAENDSTGEGEQLDYSGSDVRFLDLRDG